MEQKKEYIAKKTTPSIIKCPICGSNVYECVIDRTNIQFLNERLADAKLNETITLTRLIWNAFPERRTEADAEAVIEHLSKTVLTTVQTQINETLKPIKIFTETFPEIIETLPNSVRKDIEEKFDETKRRLEEEFKMLREVTPTFESVTDALQTIANKMEDITKKEISEIKQELAEKFRDALAKMGFPEPEQMKLLAQLVPAVLPLLEELIRFQKIPNEKGRKGETEIIEELSNFYPEDEYEHLGRPGDVDIIAKLRHNGTNLENKILIESKKNNSGWNRTFIEETRKHMQIRGERLAILAVETMPKAAAKGFLIEHCSEGVIFITCRTNLSVTYGAIRSVFIALHKFEKTTDLRKVLADKRIEDSISDAYEYKEYVKKIRGKALKIITNAKGITENIDELDNSLKQALKELQQRINDAVQEIDKEW